MRLRKTGKNPIGHELDKNDKRRNKFLVQRLEYGHDETVYWNLDTTLAILVYNFFANHNIGVPGSYSDGEWEKISNKIISGCEIYLSHEDKILSEDERIKWNEAKQLVSDNWECLWN